MPRTGRRRGSPDTRTEIVEAARAAFAEHGYDHTSVRAVAARAGVDAALVHHYFGTKEALFAAAMELPLIPSEVLPAVIHGDPDHLGERIVTAFLRVWDSPGGGAVGAAVFRSIAHDAWAGRLLREYLLRRILLPALRESGVENPELRGTLAASQMVGLALLRYVVRVEPLATLPAETLVPLLAPTLQRYLTGDLPEPPTA